VVTNLYARIRFYYQFITFFGRSGLTPPWLPLVSSGASSATMSLPLYCWSVNSLGQAEREIEDVWREIGGSPLVAVGVIHFLRTFLFITRRLFASSPSLGMPVPKSVVIMNYPGSAMAVHVLKGNESPGLCFEAITQTFRVHWCWRVRHSQMFADASCLRENLKGCLVTLLWYYCWIIGVQGTKYWRYQVPKAPAGFPWQRCYSRSWVTLFLWPTASTPDSRSWIMERRHLWRSSIW